MEADNISLINELEDNLSQSKFTIKIQDSKIRQMEIFMDSKIIQLNNVYCIELHLRDGKSI